MNADIIVTCRKMHLFQLFYIQIYVHDNDVK